MRCRWTGYLVLRTVPLSAVFAAVLAWFRLSREGQA